MANMGRLVFSLLVGVVLSVSVFTARSPIHTFAGAQNHTELLGESSAAGDKRGSSKAATAEEIPDKDVVYCYPNPASTHATIVYHLPLGISDPMLRIFDLAGRLVRQVELDPEQTTVAWDLTASDGEALPNGLYFCVITKAKARGKLLIDR